MPFPPRDSQTRIKHGILREYTGAWASIIGMGARPSYLSAQARGREWTLPLVYVDGFGGAGRYAGDSDQPETNEPIWGSPIIGMKALEAAAERLGIPVEVSGIVVEANPDYFDELVANIEASGVRTPRDVRGRVADAIPGRLTLVRGDFREHVRDLRRWLADRFALVLVDPFGTGMPMSALEMLLRRPRTDAIVLFPVLDIDRKGGSAKKPESERTPEDRGNITRVDEVFGSTRWREVACDPSLSLAVREEIYTNMYEERLQQINPELAVKNIPLRLSAVNRTAYRLFLTTSDGDGALRMNAILRGAEFREHFTLWADFLERQRRKEEGQGLLSLFDLPPSPPPAVHETAVETAEVIRSFDDLCPVGTYTLKGIYGKMANTIFTEGEVNKALRQLRAGGRVDYEGELKGKGKVVRRLK